MFIDVAVVNKHNTIYANGNRNVTKKRKLASLNNNS